MINSEAEMLALGAELAKVVPPQIVIYLVGDLGAGKTTLTRGFLKALGWQERIKSPTYTLVESYNLQKNTVYHFDLYRLNAAAELEDIGIREYFFEPAICLIEWPEKGVGALPLPDLTFEIKVLSEQREVALIAGSALGEKMVML